MSWQSLVGVVRTPLAELADQLGLRIEQSFNEEYDCEFAYLETDHDTYTLTHWAPSEDVEVWAAVRSENEPGTVDFPVGTAEFRRFLDLVDVAPDDIVIPRGLGSQPSRG